LDTLGASHPTGRRIAVLGEMLELGDETVPLHEACGRHAVAAGVQRLVTSEQSGVCWSLDTASDIDERRRRPHRRGQGPPAIQSPDQPRAEPRRCGAAR
ncbi:MAG: hypothetical protein ABL889_21135, partial [Terricaulis sp.]